MTYRPILEDIISIYTTDYSGFEDKVGYCDYNQYRQQLDDLERIGEVSAERFEKLIQRMLLDFQDAHMSFGRTGQAKPKTHGLDVRRFEDHLFVLSAYPETGLTKGDQIVQIGGLTIPELEKRHWHELVTLGKSIERQRWNGVLTQYDTCQVVGENGVTTIDLLQLESQPYESTYAFEVIDSNIGVLTLSDFFDTDAINTVLDREKQHIDQCAGLIIDVRKNRGGSDSAFYKLLSYCFDNKVDLKALDNAPMQMNMTRRNQDLRKASFTESIAKTQDNSYKKFLQAFLDVLEKYKDQGLVVVDFHDILPDMEIIGNGIFRQVVVLTDVTCGSSGDGFIELVKCSPKVTVMGRGTAGVTDYSNLATQPYEEGFVLNYPTSRNALIDQGLGISGVGHAPHVNIPWTPAHLIEDLDVQQAIAFLKENASK